VITLALHGSNGHQVHWQLVRRPDPRVRLAAVSAFPEELVAELRAAGLAGCDVLPDLDAVLARRDVDLVVLCSPRRDRQADEAVRCLRTGRHVYAEKPCALSEADLDRVLAAASAAGRRFHEMAGTAFTQPFFAMRQVVRAGTIGEVVQVLAQKSYPLHARRPQDEGVDGGLLMQAGIHAIRMIEQVGGVPVAGIVSAAETGLGNLVPGGGLRIAAAVQMRLANGGLASMAANYLNPPAFGTWGNETLRVFGTQGMLEATDGGTRTRLVLRDRDAGPLDVSAPGVDWFTAVVDEIVDGKPMPLALDDELHPTRVVIRAKAAAGAP
jgi:predicted dehydrogenase